MRNAQDIAREINEGLSKKFGAYAYNVWVLNAIGHDIVQVDFAQAPPGASDLQKLNAPVSVRLSIDALSWPQGTDAPQKLTVWTSRASGGVKMRKGSAKPCKVADKVIAWFDKNEYRLKGDGLQKNPAVVVGKRWNAVRGQRWVSGILPSGNVEVSSEGSERKTRVSSQGLASTIAHDERSYDIYRRALANPAKRREMVQQAYTRHSQGNPLGTLPAAGQLTWDSVYFDGISLGYTEARAAKAAWSVVKKKYTKLGGVWVKTTQSNPLRPGDLTDAEWKQYQAAYHRKREAKGSETECRSAGLAAVYRTRRAKARAKAPVKAVTPPVPEPETKDTPKQIDLIPKDNPMATKKTSGIILTPERSQHGATYRMKISGKVGRIGISGRVENVHIGLDEITPSLVERSVTVSRSDGSGKSLSWLAKDKVHKAVLAKLRGLEALETLTQGNPPKRIWERSKDPETGNDVWTYQPDFSTKKYPHAELLVERVGGQTGSEYRATVRDALYSGFDETLVKTPQKSSLADAQKAAERWAAKHAKKPKAKWSLMGSYANPHTNPHTKAKWHKSGTSYNTKRSTPTMDGPATLRVSKNLGKGTGYSAAAIVKVSSGRTFPRFIGSYLSLAAAKYGAETWAIVHSKWEQSDAPKFTARDRRVDAMVRDHRKAKRAKRNPLDVAWEIDITRGTDKFHFSTHHYGKMEWAGSGFASVENAEAAARKTIKKEHGKVAGGVWVSYPTGYRKAKRAKAKGTKSNPGKTWAQLTKRWSSDGKQNERMRKEYESLMSGIKDIPREDRADYRAWVVEQVEAMERIPAEYHEPTLTSGMARSNPVKKKKVTKAARKYEVSLTVDLKTDDDKVRKMYKFRRTVSAPSQKVATQLVREQLYENLDEAYGEDNYSRNTKAFAVLLKATKKKKTTAKKKKGAAKKKKGAAKRKKSPTKRKKSPTKRKKTPKK